MSRAYFAALATAFCYGISSVLEDRAARRTPVTGKSGKRAAFRATLSVGYMAGMALSMVASMWNRSSEEMRWSKSSLPTSIWIQWTVHHQPDLLLNCHSGERAATDVDWKSPVFVGREDAVVVEIAESETVADDGGAWVRHVESDCTNLVGGRPVEALLPPEVASRVRAAAQVG